MDEAEIKFRRRSDQKPGRLPSADAVLADLAGDPENPAAAAASRLMEARTDLSRLCLAAIGGVDGTAVRNWPLVLALASMGVSEDRILEMSALASGDDADPDALTPMAPRMGWLGSMDWRDAPCLETRLAIIGVIVSGLERRVSSGLPGR